MILSVETAVKSRYLYLYLQISTDGQVWVKQQPSITIYRLRNQGNKRLFSLFVKESLPFLFSACRKQTEVAALC
jgi:hypothetical protein